MMSLIFLILLSLPLHLAIHISYHTPLKSGHIARHTPFFPFSSKDISSKEIVTSEGECPPEGQTCPLDELCCPGTCCTSDFPNCYSAGCLNSLGQTQCMTPTGSQVVGTLCPNLVNCCTKPPFTRCSVDFPQFCVDEQGYVGCGSPVKRGVLCVSAVPGEEYCCPNPMKCCATSASGCCREGVADVQPVADLVMGSPGSKPKGKSKPILAIAPVGVDDIVPSMEAEFSTEPEETIEVEADVGEEATCFPADAMVEVLGRGSVRMDDVNTGEWVKTMNGFERIVLWTHYDKTWTGQYRWIKVRESVVKATKGHLIFVKGMAGEEVKAVEEVDVGDEVWSEGWGWEKVESVGWKRGMGLFNPQTEGGSIVVDGIGISCFTRAVDFRAGHAGLTPLRAAYRFLSLIKT